MDYDLQFRPLKNPPPAKLILDYRKDAGFDSPLPRAMADDPRGKLQWVSVEANGKQVAIARLEIAAPEFCFVSELMVRSAYRGKGIGRWFIHRIEQYCLGMGIRRLLLQAADGTETFYRAMAFFPEPLIPNLLRKEISPLQRRVFSPLFNN